MGSGKQFAERLTPQDVGAGGSDELVSRVGLAALELFDMKRAYKAGDVPFQPLLEPGGTELVPVANRHRTPIPGDRKSVVSGKSVSVRVDRGGRRSIKKKI